MEMKNLPPSFLIAFVLLTACTPAPSATHVTLAIPTPQVDEITATPRLVTATAVTPAIPTPQVDEITATPLLVTTTPEPSDTPTSTPSAMATPTPTITPPAPNPAYPLLSVRLQAVQVSDDDGRRTAHITAQQVKQWVAKANEIFAKASVRFIYDPALDFTTLKNTLLNDMIGDTDANWKREVDVGNGVAAGYAGKLVVFFIYGPAQGPTGSGFSSADYNFVEMPGFNDTRVCGYQNIGILAHEIGHYFGLSHPFAKVFARIQEAQSYLTAHGNDPSVFDGDGLSDTPPDPFIDIPEFQCNPIQSITLNGRVFLLPRKNIMSYYSNPGVDRTDLTPQQSNIVRWVLGFRAKNGMATPTNIDIPGAIEFATLPIKDKTTATCNLQDMSNFGDARRWSGGKQLFCSAQLNSTIEFSISASSAGKYRLNLYATMAPDYGKIHTLVDDNPLGAPIDLYAPIVLPSGRISIGTIDLSAGTHALRFGVVGKNAASSGYSCGLNAFTLTPGE
jgi:hypothetical protein